jgi:membrane-associated protease RseP (regulator of RpoE activity)
MRFRLVSATVAVLAVMFLSTTPLHAQGFLDRLERTLVGPPEESEPAKAAPVGASSYLGLVGDDAGEGEKGVRVLSVSDGGPAAKGGIAADDVVVGVKGQAIRSIDEMARLLAAIRPGEEVEMTIVRGGVTRKVTIVPTLRPPPEDSPTLPEAPDELPPPPAAVEPSRTLPGVTGGRAVLGIQVLPVTAETARRYSLTTRQGVLVNVVNSGSPAAKAGIPVGSVIVSMDGRRVDTVDDLLAGLRTKKPGDVVEVGYFVGRRLARARVELAASLIPSVVVDPPRVAETRPSLPPARVNPSVDETRPIFRGGGDRPILREVEGILDRVIPNNPVDLTPPLAGAVTDPEKDALQREVIELRAQVQSLQDRIADLERLLEESRD